MSDQRHYGIADFEAGEPLPDERGKNEPLQHEWIGKPFSVFDKCKHCGVSPCGSWLDAKAVYGPCPARAAHPAVEVLDELEKQMSSGSWDGSVYECLVMLRKLRAAKNV